MLNLIVIIYFKYGGFLTLNFITKMITKRILFSSLIAQGIRNYKKKDHLFSTSKIFIKNGNLRFEDKHFNMDLYLFNPLITMKNLNSFMIKEDSFVLAFSFAHKISHSV